MTELILQHWSYYLLLSLLGLGVAGSLPIGFLQFFKRSGDRRANLFLGSLLIAAGLSLLHNILVSTSFYDYRPGLRYLPVYFSLLLPTLLFYYVKLSAYPSYRMRWTDLKHFVLPLFQWIFFWIVFLREPARKLQWEDSFYNPFYGGFEKGLFLVLMVAYLYFAFRYVRHRQREITRSRLPRKLWYLRNFVKGLFVLFAIHATFLLGGFAARHLFRVHLDTVAIYAALGALSFAGIVYWLTVYGFQVLVWGRRVFGASK